MVLSDFGQMFNVTCDCDDLCTEMLNVHDILLTDLSSHTDLWQTLYLGLHFLEGERLVLENQNVYCFKHLNIMSS